MTASLLDQKVLVLNRSWVPVHLAPVRRALTLLFSDQAVALDEEFRTYNFRDWQELSAAVQGGRRIRTITTHLLVPAVIVLTGYNRVPKRTVRLSRRNIYARDRGVCQYFRYWLSGLRDPHDWDG